MVKDKSKEGTRKKMVTRLSNFERNNFIEY